MEENPFFNIKKGADNFVGEDLEFQVVGKHKPIAKTEANNTSFKGIKYTQKSTSELSLRKIEQSDKKDKEIIKLSPEIYGVGINLKLLYKKIKNWFIK